MSEYIGLATAALGVASFAAVVLFARRRPGALQPPDPSRATNISGMTGGDNATVTTSTAPRTPQINARNGILGGGLALSEELSMRKHLDWRVLIHSDTVFTPGTVSVLPADVLALQRLTACKGQMFFVHMLTSTGDAAQAAEKESVVAWAKENLAPTGWARHNLIFCASDKAQEAIPRQLQPTLLVAHQKPLCEFMAKHTPYVMCVDRSYTAGHPTQILTYVSLSSAPF